VDRRLTITVGAGSAALALIVGVFFVPDTGGDLPVAPPPVEPGAPRPVARTVPSAAPSSRPAQAPKVPPIDLDVGWNQGAPPPLTGALVPRVAPRPPVDPDKEYDGAMQGVSTALFDRHPRLVACYEEHSATYGDVDGRPTVRATLLPEPDEDGVRFHVQIENRGTALGELDACFREAVADARFGDVDIPTSVLQPIPLPASR
jgi:hypothetical protein